MATIEIDITIYNKLNSRIKELENKIVEQEKKLNVSNEIVGELKDTLDYIVNDTTLMDRLFNWKFISNIVNNELKKI